MASQIFLMVLWASSRAWTNLASPISWAPHSTMVIASRVPATMRSRLDFARSDEVGMITNSPSIWPMRTAPSGPEKGMSEIAIAAATPTIDITSGSFSWSKEMTIDWQLVSRL